MGVVENLAFHGVNGFGVSVEDQIHVGFFDLVLVEVEAFGILPEGEGLEVMVGHRGTGVWSECAVHFDLVEGEPSGLRFDDDP